MTLPAEVTLPSGRRVRLAWSGPTRPAGEEPTLAASLAILVRDLVVRERDAPVDIQTLPLGDFHLLRALAMHASLLSEDAVTVDCRNCDAPITAKPCAAMEIAPYVDDELGDEELDSTLPFGEPIPIAPVPLGRVRTAKTITFRARTVAEAIALLEAPRDEPLALTAAIVDALGISALGSEKNTSAIATALATCDEAAFAPVADAFLASHYPLRLAGIVFCPSCRARNEIDAPYERELERSALPMAEGEAFPSFEAFDARARAIAEPLLAEAPGEVELVIDGAPSAVDDGGESLWGCYQPRLPDGFGGETAPATVTLFHRTFEAVWNEEGPYDWEAEIEETVAHELEHHVYALRGDDPKDEEEHEAIRRENERVVGRTETRRREVAGFADGLKSFLLRAWPLVAIGFVALVLWLLSQRE